MLGRLNWNMWFGISVVLAAAVLPVSALPVGDKWLYDSLSDVTFSIGSGSAEVDCEVYKYTSGIYSGKYVYAYQISNIDSGVGLSLFSVEILDGANAFDPDYEPLSGVVYPDLWTVVGQPAERVEALFTGTIADGEISTILWFVSDYESTLGEGTLSAGAVSATENLLTSAPRFSGAGSGTEGDPYIITNAYQLQEMNYDLDAWYELGNDIDASDTVNWNGGAGFLPVGTSVNIFRGYFDGKGHTITGLYINRPDTSHVGLFGYVSNGNADIRDLILTQANIDGNGYVGALIGCLRSGTVRECGTYAGTVRGNSRVGGLVGESTGRILNCFASADVEALSSSSGGLVGMNYKILDLMFPSGQITNCYATGSVTGISNVGGLAGYYKRGSISNCYAVAHVTGYDYIGGLVGYDFVGGYTGYCFWDSDVNPSLTGIGNIQDPPSVIGETTENMKIESTFTSANWDFDTVWDIIENISYPFLREVGPDNYYFSLTFPLQNRNAYNARITAVFDHSMLDSYCPDDKMVTYSGEETTLKTDDKYSPIYIQDCDGDGIEEPLYSFYKPGGGAFLVGKVNYVGIGSEQNNLVLQYDAHPGYDYNDVLGTPVFAAAEGDLSVVSESLGWVKITHTGPGAGYETHYAHLNTHIDPRGVGRGEPIGTVGDRGAEGPHLHFEVKHNDIPVDPYGWEGSGTDPYTMLTGADNVRLWETSDTVNPGIDYILGSPADMVVTDPDGFHISKELNQIPRAAYDEVDIDGDGDLEDRVSIIDKKVGEYLIDVIPEPNALPTDTYSLEVTTGGQTMVLAQDVAIQDIPDEPYVFESKLNRADFDADGDVDIADLNSLSQYWLAGDCNYPNWCEGTDLNYNGRVDFADFALFAENWLWETIRGDFDIDGDVDFEDFAIFSLAWLSADGQAQYNPDCDISSPADGLIDWRDLAVLAENWLVGK